MVGHSVFRQLAPLAKLFRLEDVFTYIAPIAFRFATDTVAEVREDSIPSVCYVWCHGSTAYNARIR